jgi:hypothetical protein
MGFGKFRLFVVEFLPPPATRTSLSARLAQLTLIDRLTSFQ